MPERGPDRAGERRIDFAGLRSEVEAAVMLPEFRQVTRRARWRRTRHRLTTAGTVLLVVGILGPAGVVADLHRGNVNGWVSPDQENPTIVASGAPTSSPPVQAQLLTAAGVDLVHAFALADVCAGDSCSLELFRLSGSGVNRPVATGLLRGAPTDYLDSVTLSALSENSVLVSGTDGDRWKYQPVDLTKAKDGPPAQQTTPSVTIADRVVQLSRFGKLQAVQARSGRQLQLPAQPPLTQPTVVDNISPSMGIWATGTGPNKELAISVSRDAGHTWATQPLGIPAAQLSTFDRPVLASYDGKAAYLLVRLADEEFALFATADSGRTWQRRTAPLPWPQPVPVGAPFGLVVRPDGALLAWLDSSPTITYLESTDTGRSFRVTSNGPSAPVVWVSNGYVELGSQPSVSSNAANWARIPISYAPPGS